MRSITLTAGAVVVAAASTAMAGFDVYLDGGANSTLQNFGTGNYVAGSEFTITAPTPVGSLGWIDAEGDGLTNSHRIGLWNTADQSLIAEATVTPSSMTVPSAQGTAQWFLQELEGGSIILQPGTYRVAGEVNGDSVALSNDKIANGGTSITAGYVRTDFPNGGFNYPDLTFSSEAIRATISPIPAPGALALLGLAGVAGTRRRR